MTGAPQKHTLVEAKEIIAKGYPAVAALLPTLVAWVADMNSSGASEIADFLATTGRPIIPYIKPALQGQDRQWQSNILYAVMRYWPRELIDELAAELDDL